MPRSNGQCRLLSIAWFVALALLIAPLPSIAAPSTTLDGDWTGGFILDGDWVTVELTLKTGPMGFDGVADLAFMDYEGQQGIALTATALEGSSVRFTVPTGRGPVAFDGRLASGTIVGNFRLAGTSGGFGMTRVIALNSADRATSWDRGADLRFQGSRRVLRPCRRQRLWRPRR